jgi:hypothetical protein
MPSGRNCSDYIDDGLAKVLSKHVRKISTHLMFGPGYSSDNAGDGPRGARFRCPTTGRFLKNVSNTSSPSPPRTKPISIEEEIAEKDLWVFPNLPQDTGAGKNLVCQSRFNSGELWLYQPGVPLHLQDPKKRRKVIVPSVDNEQLISKLQTDHHAQIYVDDNNVNIGDSYASTKLTQSDDDECVDLSVFVEELNSDHESTGSKPDHTQANELALICRSKHSSAFPCSLSFSREVHEYVEVPVLKNCGTSSNENGEEVCFPDLGMNQGKQT